MRRDDGAGAAWTVRLLRFLHSWSQRRLAREAKLSPKEVWSYEAGRQAPTRASLERLAQAANVHLKEVEPLVPSLMRLVRRAAGKSGAAHAINEAVAERLAATALAAIEAELPRVLADLPPLVPERTFEAERARAAELWNLLAACLPSERLVLVGNDPVFATWAMVERLCDESERAAAADAGQALDWAGLGSLAAHQVEDEAACRRLRGYAQAHLANARRVGNDLSGAERDLAQAWELWEMGTPAQDLPLEESRLFDLEASLRRGQRRLSEALSLLDKALTVCRSSEAKGRILLKKSATLEQMGDVEGSLQALAAAAQLLDKEKAPRQFCVLRFNQAVNLCHLGRFEEAQVLLPEVRSLAEGLGHDLDLLRVCWLEGRTQAGLGRPEEAIAALEEVRQGFTHRKLPYDTALATLDLAIVLLEQGETARVRGLAEEMLWLFKAQGIPREALAALRLFQEAAEREAATVELARRAVETLRKGV